MADENVTLDAQDVYDRLDNKLKHLESMLMMTYGNARESFDAMNDRLRDNYLWACGDAVHECLVLTKQLGSEIYKPKALTA